MSSPFSLETKGASEKSIEALSRTREWAARINTTSEVEDLDMIFVEDLKEAEENLREKYRIRNTEVEVDNFVFNHPDAVENILCGNLTSRTNELDNLENYISEAFGYVKPLDLSLDELVWLVAQEVMYHQESTYGVDKYDEDKFTGVDIENMGEQPSFWDDEYPLYNRD